MTGLLVEVTHADPYRVAPTTHTFNRPGSNERLDVPAESVLTADPVTPSNLTHVVYGTPDQPTTLAFFTDVIGFEISDQVPGIVAFTRCGEVHHNLAIQAAPVAFPHHIAFEVDDIDDVVRGGQAMVDADPDRHMWGVGRHAIGSNWFWYLRDPSRTFVEGLAGPRVPLLVRPADPARVPRTGRHGGPRRRQHVTIGVRHQSRSRTGRGWFPAP